MSDRPPSDPKQMLEEWLQWERGEIEPGRLIGNLKKAGMKELLEQLASAAAEPAD